MPKEHLKIADLEVAVQVLRELAAGGSGAFDVVAAKTKTPRTNGVEAFDRVEKHFSVHLIAREGARERRGNVITAAGRLVLKHGAQLLWAHSELVDDLASLEFE